ncbi:MAG TPA: ABC transporter permease subunit [Candidatus Limnocylindrales bacterium]|nr:ABC transporter permease subunit [Candidatus Limnocylindrales bacterium]
MSGPTSQSLTGLEPLAESIAKPSRRSPASPVVMSWIVLLVSILYFGLPLVGTLIFSLRAQPFGEAYKMMVSDGQLFKDLGYSFVIAIITVLVSIGLLVPTAFWVRLRLPRLRPIIEFITLLPFVIPPIVLVYGLLSTFSGPPLALTGSNLGSDALLVCAYVVLSFPYMYRSIDAGLRVIDIRTLTEACQSLGAGWFTVLWRVILPNLRVAILSGAFLTLAIVVGEFTVAIFLARPMFATYLQLISQTQAYESAAVALMSFAITWAAMGVISLIGRGRQEKIIAGVH